jgi:hypothetical protein
MRKGKFGFGTRKRYSILTRLFNLNSRRAAAKSFDKQEGQFRLSAALDGVLAQLVEHHNGIVGVKGSNPLGSTIRRIRAVLSGNSFHKLPESCKPSSII